MALKAVVDTLDSVNEDLRDLYTEKDGKYRLKVDGMQHDDEVNGLKTALVKERENVAAYKKLGSPDEIQQRIDAAEAKAREAGKGKSDEDHEKIIADLRKEYEDKIAAQGQSITQMRQASTSEKLKAELAKQGVVPEGLDLLAGFAASRIQFNDDGSPKVLSRDGSGPMIGNGANGGATLEDLAKELAGSIPHLVKDGGSGGSGKQPNTNGGTPKKKFSEMTSGELVSLRRDNPQEYDRLKAEG